MATKKTPAPLRRVFLGKVTVDSGRLIIIDPCNIEHIDPDPDIMEDYTDTKTRSGVIKIVPNRKALVFESGFGDGEYEVYGIMRKTSQHKEYVVGIEILM